MAKTAANFDLAAAAKQAMLEYGFQPDFSQAAQQQLTQIAQHPPAAVATDGIRDRRGLLWSSIDNDTSRDLDQIEVAEQLADGRARVLIGIADVDAFVAKGTPLDGHAASETTSVYTGVRIFPMLPEQLSNGASSLLEGGDKLAVVIEFVVEKDGNVGDSSLYRAIVRNHAQLAYNGVGAWLEASGPAPGKVAASAELQQQLRLQDEIAQLLKEQRHQHGALELDTVEVRPVLANQQVVDIARLEKNRATDLIEDFMIAANGVSARTLQQKNMASIRRVVKTPKRWDRIVELARQRKGWILPAEPDSKALNDFLSAQRVADPDHFADISLTVIKLMGPGEYVMERPGDVVQGHFGLAVQDYTHSTAPNRRFADIATQRLIKAVIAGSPSPYSESELESIANNCTQKEDAARKVERIMTKRIAAVAMLKRIGQTFKGIVTGVTPSGTFVRVLDPHVEGLLARGAEGADVGDRVNVKLISADPQRGYIDFARV